jgi:aryl-alcohol dehydrogenase-like predicted oxidoreductase
LNRSYEVGLSEISIREQAGLLAYSPMACGRLSGKYIEGKDKPQDRINQFPQFSRYNTPNCLLATQHYYDIAKKYGISLAHMSLAWINQQEFVTANIIGATSIEQLHENIASIDINLSEECVKEINKVHEMIPDPAT